MISKAPESIDNYYHQIIYYDNARNAFEDILLNLMEHQESTILLPAFIGYSPKEGSGIFDPILHTGIQYKFYAMTKELFIDINDLKEKEESIQGKKIVLLVHYLGYADPNYNQVINLCKKQNAIIIEDAAHAFYTEYYNHKIGKKADYIIYSLHKMLPFKNGGMLKIQKKNKFRIYHKAHTSYDILAYNIAEISKTRKKNSLIIENALKNNEKITLLRPNNKFAESIPQTYPILLKNSIDRYAVYLELNRLGFGVVSLYHTLISELSDNIYSNSKELSSSILNLPVHQDASKEEITEMCHELNKIINRY